MSVDVIDSVLAKLVEEDLLGSTLNISWHGGEPLAAGLSWYKDVFPRIASNLNAHAKVAHIFQTNGVLITDAWCDFFVDQKVSVGVSVDGPIDQSAARVNWSGQSAYPAVMRGISLLNRHGIKWTLLAVINRKAMENPSDFIDFVKATGCSVLGLKVEENNVNYKSRLSNQGDILDLYRSFISALWTAFPEESDLKIREFIDYRSHKTSSVVQQTLPVTLIPFNDLTVKTNGDFTIFSPELLFFEDRKFVFGNVLNGSLLDCLNSEKFTEMTESIFRGVSKCAESCEFYAACGSFYISQKYSEMKSFDATETLACALEIKTLFKTLNEHCIT